MIVKKTTSPNWSVLKLSDSQTHEPPCAPQDDSCFCLCNFHLSFINELVISIIGETRNSP